MDAGLACTLRATDDYGFCASVAIHFAPRTPVPLLEMYTKGVTFHVSRSDSRLLLPELLDLVVSERLDPNAVPATVVSWEERQRLGWSSRSSLWLAANHQTFDPPPHNPKVAGSNPAHAIGGRPAYAGPISF